MSGPPLQERELFIILNGKLEIRERRAFSGSRGTARRRPPRCESMWTPSCGDLAGYESFSSHSGRRLFEIVATADETSLLVVRPSVLKSVRDILPTPTEDLLWHAYRELADHLERTA